MYKKVTKEEAAYLAIQRVLEREEERRKRNEEEMQRLFNPKRQIDLADPDIPTCYGA